MYIWSEHTVAGKQPQTEGRPWEARHQGTRSTPSTGSICVRQLTVWSERRRPSQSCWGERDGPGSTEKMLHGCLYSKPEVHKLWLRTSMQGPLFCRHRPPQVAQLPGPHMQRIAACVATMRCCVRLSIQCDCLGAHSAWFSGGGRRATDDHQSSCRGTTPIKRRMRRPEDSSS